jgi:hypothetical protein
MTSDKDGNWPGDASQENGNYNCTCCQCGLVFIGHKRRVQCRACAKPEDQLVEATVELKRIKAQLAIKGGDATWPTKWAYESACAALDKHRKRADDAEAALRTIAETPAHHAGQTPNEFHFQQLARQTLGVPKQYQPRLCEIDDPITQSELDAAFGESMPVSVAEVLYHSGMTLATSMELRKAVNAALVKLEKGDQDG